MTAAAVTAAAAHTGAAAGEKGEKCDVSYDAMSDTPICDATSNCLCEVSTCIKWADYDTEACIPPFYWHKYLVLLV